MTQLPSSFGKKRKRDQVPALGVASGCQAALPAGSRGLPAMEGCQEGGPGACSLSPLPAPLPLLCLCGQWGQWHR